MSLDRASVLVTGGAGFIGSELINQLASSGARVLIVDNLVNGKRENVEGVLGDRVTFETTDIRDDAKMRALLKGVDLVYHLACLGVRHSIHSPQENHEVNASATLALLAGCREAGVKRFVHVSSSEVYGTAKYVPMDEGCPTFPHTVYGASKLAGECYARAYWKTYGFPTVVVRPFNCYGIRSHHEGDSGEVIPKFILRAMSGKPLIVFGDGNQTRDFTYVEDTARSILRAGFIDKAVGETINIGQGREISVKTLADAVIKVVGKPGVAVEHIESRPGDVLRLYADTALAGRILDHKPSIGLVEGLNRLKTWYESKGVSPEKLLEQESVRNWVAE